jgi:hypothetical protein
MFISDILHQLSENLSSYDITLYSPATDRGLTDLERKLKCPLPDDMTALYRFCNGFESAEDMFRLIPLEEIADRLSDCKPNCFLFAEYMIYSDMWEIEINPSKPNEYWISNPGKVFLPFNSVFSRVFRSIPGKGSF